jgi:hypothetical protein
VIIGPVSHVPITEFPAVIRRGAGPIPNHRLGQGQPWSGAVQLLCA